VTHLDHIGLSVADLDAQAAWYSDALGLQATTPFAVEDLGIRGVFLVDAQQKWAIELLSREGSVPGLQAPDPPTAVLTRGYGHICLRVEDVDSTFEKLIAAGARERMAPRPAPEPGVRMAYVADPEGHLIELLDRPWPVGGIAEKI
jgi:catechol 2,3-dioxygenase-like lactoylglutathione lyase family enzyme